MVLGVVVAAGELRAGPIPRRPLQGPGRCRSAHQPDGAAVRHEDAIQVPELPVLGRARRGGLEGDREAPEGRIAQAVAWITPLWSGPNRPATDSPRC